MTTLQALAEIAPLRIMQICQPGISHCVASTAIGQMVLASWGISAQPFPTQFTACNQAWLDWAHDGFTGGADEQQSRGAYLLSDPAEWNGASSQTVVIPKAWDGHLVLAVAVREWTGRWARYLVDLDLGSSARPQRNILLPPALVAPFRADGTVALTMTHGAVSSYVAYQPLVAPDADDYQQAKDWTARHRYTDVVAEIVARMKDIL